jgi:hypothetical protein
MSNSETQRCAAISARKAAGESHRTPDTSGKREKMGSTWVRVGEFTAAAIGVWSLLGGCVYFAVSPYIGAYFGTFGISLQEVGISSSTMLANGSAPVLAVALAAALFVGMVAPWHGKSRKESWLGQVGFVLIFGSTVVLELSASQDLRIAVVMSAIALGLMFVGGLIRVNVLPNDRRTLVVRSLVVMTLLVVAVRPLAASAGKHDANALISLKPSLTMVPSPWQKMAGMRTLWQAQRIDSDGLSGVASHYNGDWVRRLGSTSGRGFFIDLSKCEIVSFPDADLGFSLGNDGNDTIHSDLRPCGGVQLPRSS